VAELRRRLGIVSDFGCSRSPAEANVAFALEVISTPSANIPGKVARALTRVGLAQSRLFRRSCRAASSSGWRLPALVNDRSSSRRQPTGTSTMRHPRHLPTLREINAAGTAVRWHAHDLELVSAQNTDVSSSTMAAV
jgi:ABC-type ATPase involved in cell division